MTAKDLKKQYIKEFGYSSFNKYNNTDYSKWLESQLISALNEVIKLGLHSVSNWVAVKNDLPNDDNQVFVKYHNGKYGINEWWESDNCWKYNFDNMIVKEWCKPPCC